MGMDWFRISIWSRVISGLVLRNRKCRLLWLCRSRRASTASWANGMSKESDPPCRHTTKAFGGMRNADRKLVAEATISGDGGTTMWGTIGRMPDSTISPVTCLQTRHHYTYIQLQFAWKNLQTLHQNTYIHTYIQTHKQTNDILPIEVDFRF